MEANSAIKEAMDTADKYGYGEWTLMSQVPTMTSNTAPYGQVVYSSISTGQSYLLSYGPFDSRAWTDDTKIFAASGTALGDWYGYCFTSPVCVKGFKARVTLSRLRDYKIEGSNTGNTNDWTTVYSGTNSDTSESFGDINAEFSNNDAYLYWRIYRVSWNTANTNLTIAKLQFYAYAPKGNVPIMTSNTAPYGTASDNSHVNNDHIACYAFDGGYTNYWQPADSTGTVSVGYQFVNPIMPRRVKIHINQGADVIKQRISSFVIKGSNDGSTYQSLLTINTDNLSSNIIYGDISNDDYYLYLKLECVKKVSSSFSMFVLQFYGRELSVSIPIMTGDSTPFGRGFCIQGGAHTSDIKYAFDGTYHWYSTAQNAYVGYNFEKDVNIKMLYFDAGYTANGTSVPNITVNFEASNDDFTTVVDLNKSVTVVSPQTSGSYAHTTKQYISLDDCKYNQIRAKALGTSYAWGSWGIWFGFQAWGLDYSEREFEQGTTKKWLYDHGVELETINKSANVVENDSYLTINTSGEQFNVQDIDLSDYSIIRSKVGSHFSATSVIGVFASGSSVAGYTFVSGNHPNNHGLSVSSINQSATVNISISSSGTDDYTEWWLE